MMSSISGMTNPVILMHLSVLKSAIAPASRPEITASTEEAVCFT